MLQADLSEYLGSHQFKKLRQVGSHYTGRSWDFYINW